MTDPKKPTDPSSPPAHPNGTPSDHATRFVSSRPPEGGEARTLAEWVQFVARCPHPTNGIARETLVDSQDKRGAFEWCGTCGAVRLPNEAHGAWTVPGLALILRAESVGNFEQETGALATQLAELLESARSIKAVIENESGGLGTDLIEKVRLFEVDCYQVEQGAKACLGRWTATVPVPLF